MLLGRGEENAPRMYEECAGGETIVGCCACRELPMTAESRIAESVEKKLRNQCKHSSCSQRLLTAAMAE